MPRMFIAASASLWLGVTFVVIGAINVWLVLDSSARQRDAKVSARLIAAHRIGGYLFIALFCVMGYSMVARLGGVAGGAPPGTMIHLTLAMVLSPLLFVKVLVARYYKCGVQTRTVARLRFVDPFVLPAASKSAEIAHHDDIGLELTA